MLDELFGDTGGAIAQFVLALIVVLILILIVAWLLKKLGGSRFGGSNSGQAELEIIDTLAIDPKRRLVLVRHGKLEHLLLIGGGSDEVVERSIIGGLPIAARMQANKPPAPAPEKTPEPLARPSSQFLERLERTNAARKSGTAPGSEANEAAPTAADSAAPSTGSPGANPVAASSSTPNPQAPSSSALSASAPSSSTPNLSVPSSPASTSAASSSAASSAAMTSATVTGAGGAGSAYAAMIASTNKAASKSAADASSAKPEEKAASPQPATAETKADTTATGPALSASIPATPIPAPEPIDLPPLPELSRSSSTPPAQADKSIPKAGRPIPKSEREALEQSLDDALHDSLLAPEDKPASPAPRPEPPAPQTPVLETSASPSEENQSADDMDFNLFDDGELEREMEAALADTSPSAAPSPELDAKSTAAIEAELAIDMEPPAQTSSQTKPSSHPSSASLDAATEPMKEEDEHESSASTGVSGQSEDAVDENTGNEGSNDQGKEEPQDTRPPLKDIPVELSRPDPVAVQIPSRGPAANATSVTKIDNGISGSANSMPEGPSSPVNLSQLLDSTSVDENAPSETGTAKPSSGKSSDLDEEMRRLLGEIAGDPKAN